LITATQLIRQASASSWHWWHIKGHRDATWPLQDLDQSSLWSVDMDKAAKSHWEGTKGHSNTQPPVFGEPWPRDMLSAKRAQFHWY
jgi:hypothetical protein